VWKDRPIRIYKNIKMIEISQDKEPAIKLIDTKDTPWNISYFMPIHIEGKTEVSVSPKDAPKDTHIYFEDEDANCEVFSSPLGPMMICSNKEVD